MPCKSFPIKVYDAYLNQLRLGSGNYHITREVGPVEFRPDCSNEFIAPVAHTKEIRLTWGMIWGFDPGDKANLYIQPGDRKQDWRAYVVELIDRTPDGDHGSVYRLKVVHEAKSGRLTGASKK